MSLTHEAIRNENKELLDKIILDEEKIYELEDYKQFLKDSLWGRRRSPTDDEEEEIWNTIYEIEAQIDRINDSKRFKGDLKCTMALARITSLQSFKSRNLPDINKILSDPHLLKHITSFNIGL